MSKTEQIKLLADTLKQIGALAVEPGADAMPVLLEAQRLADNGLKQAGLAAKVLPFARLKDVDGR